jgi:hypothetical protein
MKSGSLRHPWLSLTDTLQNSDSSTEMRVRVFGRIKETNETDSFFECPKTHKYAFKQPPINKHKVCLNQVPK